MLSEVVNERIRHNMPLVPTEGACKFCGQLTVIQVPGTGRTKRKTNMQRKCVSVPKRTGTD